MAERDGAARSSDSGTAASRTDAGGCQAEAQFAVLVDVTKRARARPDAARRDAATGSEVVRPSFQAARYAAGRQLTAAARWSHAPGARSRARARAGSARGDGAEIGYCRRHGLFAFFRRFDRGRDAGRLDALRLDRRTARASRPAVLKRAILAAEPADENKPLPFLSISGHFVHIAKSSEFPLMYWRERILSD